MSPLTGIILKVALAVLLAAVTITITLTLLPDTDPAPQVTVGVEQDPGSQVVTFTHLGGDPLDPGAIAIEGPGVVSKATLQSGLESGDTIRLSNVVADPGDTVRLVWVTETQSAVLREVTFSRPYTNGSSPVTGDVTIPDDIEDSDSQFDVETSVRNASSGHLVVRNRDTSDETTRSVGNETVTITDSELPFSGGDQIQALLYESSSRSSQLDSDNEPVDTGGGGGGGGGGPGFTFTAVALAVALAALLARRQEQSGTESGGDE